MAISQLYKRIQLAETKIALAQQATTSTGGATVTFSPTPPTTAAVGDLWYNTSNGNEANQWNGTAWVPYQVGSGGIGTGAVTNANLANNSVSSANVQANAIGAGQAMSQYSGHNMITDAQFADPIITAARLADPGTLGTWALANTPIGAPFSLGHTTTTATFSSIQISVLTAVPVGSGIIVNVLTPTSTTVSGSDTKGNVYTSYALQDISGQWQHTIVALNSSTALTTSDVITVSFGTAPTWQQSVAYGIPLCYGTDTNMGFTSTSAAVNFTTQNQTNTNDVNMVFLTNTAGKTITAGGGTPSGWTYLGGANVSGYATEAVWQYAPSSLGQGVSTSYASAPSGGWLATSAGFLNSGNTGHMTVTAQQPPATLPLMTSGAAQPALYVNPGEQYFLSCNANVPGTVNCQIGMQIVLNTGTVLTVSLTSYGYMTVSGTVTIPPGASSGYVRVFAKSASGTVPGVSILNPICGLSSLYGSNYKIDSTGLTVTGAAGPITIGDTISGPGTFVVGGAGNISGSSLHIGSGGIAVDSTMVVGSTLTVGSGGPFTVTAAGAMAAPSAHIGSGGLLVDGTITCGGLAGIPSLHIGSGGLLVDTTGTFNQIITTGLQVNGSACVPKPCGDALPTSSYTLGQLITFVHDFSQAILNTGWIYP